MTCPMLRVAGGMSHPMAAAVLGKAVPRGCTCPPLELGRPWRNPEDGDGYRHERLEEPAAFDPRSFRTVETAGGDRLIIGCPRGRYDAKRGRCRVGTRAQAILHRNPEFIDMPPATRERLANMSPQSRQVSNGPNPPPIVRSAVARAPSAALRAAYDVGMQHQGKSSLAAWTDELYGPDRVNAEDVTSNAFFEAGRRGDPIPRWVAGWRRGELPASGMSFDYREQHRLKGVSMMQVEGEPVFKGMAVFGLEHRPVVHVEGWLIEPRGPEGEALLVGARVSKPVAVPNPSADRAAAAFAAWHEFPPDRLAELPIPKLDGERMVMIGNLRRIDYDSVKWSKRSPGRRSRRTYYHESTGRPVLLTNPAGSVLVAWDPSGKLRVTPDGIKG